jgi:hypothetical protein
MRAVRERADAHFATRNCTGLKIPSFVSSMLYSSQERYRRETDADPAPGLSRWICKWPGSPGLARCAAAEHLDYTMTLMPCMCLALVATVFNAHQNGRITIDTWQPVGIARRIQGANADDANIRSSCRTLEQPCSAALPPRESCKSIDAL